MLSLYYNKATVNFILALKKIFGPAQERMKKYYLKLDGYYYCTSKKCNIAVFRVRNKRTIDKIPIKDIINDKKYLRELHPFDTCIVGILANNERNGIIDQNHLGWKKMSRLKEYDCLIKSEPVLEVEGKYNNQDGIEITILRSKYLNQEIEVPTIELCKNQALLFALDSLQSIAIGYNASELFIREAPHSDQA